MSLRIPFKGGGNWYFKLEFCCMLTVRCQALKKKFNKKKNRQQRLASLEVKLSENTKSAVNHTQTKTTTLNL